MLRVTVELLPFGSEVRKKTIGSLTISNINTNGDNTADYKVVIDEENCDAAGRFVLKNFDRGRGFWALIHEVLKNC